MNEPLQRQQQQQQQQQQQTAAYRVQSRSSVGSDAATETTATTFQATPSRPESQSDATAAAATRRITDPVPTTGAKNNHRTDTTEADEDTVRCWICFGDDSDSHGRWVTPCGCTLVAHEVCLLSWIAETHRQDAFATPQCPQCRHPYSITEPVSLYVTLFETMDAVLGNAIPIVIGTGALGAVIITSTVYGAYAVLTVFGLQDGEALLLGHNGDMQHMMEESWDWRTWMGLPMIPVALLSTQSHTFDVFLPIIPCLFINPAAMRICWPPTPAMVTTCLPWVRTVYNSVMDGVFGHIEREYTLHSISRPLPTAATAQQQAQQQQQQQQQQPNLADIPEEIDDGTGFTIEFGLGRAAPGDTIDARDIQDVEQTFVISGRNLARKVVGALLLPAISAMCGGILARFSFSKHWFPSTFHRNVAGGCLFVLVKDLLTIWYKYRSIQIQKARRINNYHRSSSPALKKNATPSSE
ncbi:hypothetical protein GQ42DRAFT_15470 [Ramicandelaber brevisporus]|nr:hypothetical protein GQ42DRAFT_15470 [Ramicandelaber brevisporus]